jgi:riboflavin synthase
MFTGIITHIGTIGRIRKTGDWAVTVEAKGFTRGAGVGASVSCSGVCLTIIKKGADYFTVQASAETLARTTLGQWKEGARINLERALKVGDELGGHFVSGHVDGLAVIEKIGKSRESKVMWLSCHSRESGNPSEKIISRQTALLLDPRLRGDDGSLIRFIASKGAVTLDGVSLTVNEVKDGLFSVNIIPHTLKKTTLGERRQGDRLNLEIDLIARYLARLKEA